MMMMKTKWAFGIWKVNKKQDEICVPQNTNPTYANHTNWKFWKKMGVGGYEKDHMETLESVHVISKFFRESLISLNLCHALGS